MASSVDRRIERYLPEDMGHCDPGSLIRPRSTDPIRACGQCRAIQDGHMTASDVRCRYAKNPCKPGAIHTCPRAARSADPWGGVTKKSRTTTLARLLDRDEYRMPDLAFDMLRQVALPGRILDQDYLTRPDDPAFAVAGGYFDAGVEVDDVLAARCRVPVDVVLGLGLAKNDTGGRQALG